MYKIAICDDEKNICASLEEGIDRFFNERNEECEVEVWYDSDSFCKQVEEYKPIILFLDIELPNNNGVYVGKYIRTTLKNDRINIVYISHKTNYALELFQVHPYDFLVKPVEEDALFTTLTNILKLEEIRDKEFKYSYNKKWYTVPYGDIVYFSSKNKLVYVHKKNGETVSYYGKLRDIIDDLPFQFTCISKSYIVNIKYISTWSSGSLTLEGGMEINIAQSKRTDFKKAIFNYGCGQGNG